MKLVFVAIRMQFHQLRVKKNSVKQIEKEKSIGKL